MNPLQNRIDFCVIILLTEQILMVIQQQCHGIQEYYMMDMVKSQMFV